MDKDTLRKADFKTGTLLTLLCLWLLAVTFLFMPFKETYGGVENVWYVSPWIFPAVVLTLLLILSILLTVNAALSRGMRDLVDLGDGIGAFRLTPLGTLFVTGLIVACTAGLGYLYVNIEEKIASSLEEAKWLADPSTAVVFEWSDPLAIVPMAALSMLLVALTAVLAVSSARRRRAAAPRTAAFGEVGEAAVRFGIITLLFCVLVYLLVPNVDFFFGVLLFLIVFTSSFYIATPDVVRRSMGLYLAVGAGALLVFPTGLGDAVNGTLPYATDLAVFAATVWLMVRQGHRLAEAPEDRAKFRICLILSWLTPLILVPVFRFGLLVPLPHEGAAIEAMHQIRYLIR